MERTQFYLHHNIVTRLVVSVVQIRTSGHTLGGGIKFCQPILCHLDYLQESRVLLTNVRPTLGHPRDPRLDHCISAPQCISSTWLLNESWQNAVVCANAAHLEFSETSNIFQFFKFFFYSGSFIPAEKIMWTSSQILMGYLALMLILKKRKLRQNLRLFSRFTQKTFYFEIGRRIIFIILDFCILETLSVICLFIF